MKRAWSKQEVVEALRARQKLGQRPQKAYLTDPCLYYAAQTHFGSWQQALAAVGIFVKPQRRWSKQRVLDAIRQRYRGEKPARTGRRDTGLVGAARKHFGTWSAAVEAAGMPPVSRRQWTKQRVIDALRARQREGQSLINISKRDASLYLAGKYHFGTWANALAAAGISPTRQSWTQQRVVEVLRAYLDKNTPLAEIWKDRPLAAATGVYWGSRHSALEAAGLKLAPKQLWSKEKVIAALRLRHEQRLPMTKLRQEDRGLLMAANSHFGGMCKAMQAAGLEPLSQRWSKQRVIDELREWDRRSGDRRCKSLGAAATRYFGSVRQAMLAAGIDPDCRQWSQTRIVAALQDRYVRGKSLRRVDCEDRSLRLAVKNHFGSWAKALEAAGLG